MVKNICSILISLGILVFLSLYESSFLERKVSLFSEEVNYLAERTEEGNATIEDGKALKNSWETLKNGLYLWIPHNDIALVDANLSESLGALYSENYDLALQKMVGVYEFCERLPSSYRLSWSNIL